MNPDMTIALIGFALVMSISPGPGNFMLLASGANFGLARSLPLLLGISCGFLSMVFVVGIGFGAVLRAYPAIDTALRLVCALYVAWLAIRIARSRSLGEGGSLAAPIGFAEAAAFQLLNPKAWAVALIVTVTYTQPERLLPSLVTVIAIVAVVNLPSLSVWVLSGTALRRVLAEGSRIVVFNLAMAVLLVASMIPALLR